MKEQLFNICNAGWICVALLEIVSNSVVYAPKADTHSGICFLHVEGNGLEPIKCNSPVGSEGSAACGRINDPSEWQRSTDAKVLCHRRQMSGTATGHLLAAGLDGNNTIIYSSPVTCSADIPGTATGHPAPNRYNCVDIGIFYCCTRKCVLYWYKRYFWDSKA